MARTFPDRVRPVNAAAPVQAVKSGHLGHETPRKRPQCARSALPSRPGSNHNSAPIEAQGMGTGLEGRTGMAQRCADKIRGWPALALWAAFALSGCAASSPFSSNNDFDRTFIGAAQTWDLDKNSTVTCDEWARYVSTSLQENDSNGDGALDAQEFAKLAKSDRLFEIANLGYYDANGDGRAAREEMTAKQNVAFKLLDRNGDCQIDRTESVVVYGVDREKAKEVDQNIPKTGGSRY
jgi:Ca2+-binding EF-hand superfamily protein